MPVSSHVYANALDQAFTGQINWASDSIKIALLGSGYTPDLAVHAHFSDVSANEITGPGYTEGGAALTAVTHTVTAANAFGTTWAASAQVAADAVVRPPAGNGYLYYAEAGGTTSTTQPAWPTVVGATVVDGSVTWTCLGESIVQFSSGAVSWPNSTLSANYAVIYDAKSGATPSEPLICVIDFGGAVSSSSATFTINPPSLGWFWISPA